MGNNKERLSEDEERSCKRIEEAFEMYEGLINKEKQEKEEKERAKKEAKKARKRSPKTKKNNT